jgi:choline dehydrogenase-like flavoprotein
MDTQKAEFVVIGAGAGGAMATQELARAGKDVIMIDRGPDMSRFEGLEEMELGRLLYQDGGRFPKTEEGYAILKGLNVGGTTELAIGHGMRVFEDEFKSFGIDLGPAIEETEAELNITTMPDSHIGPNAALLTDAAESLNMSVSTWTKFIDYDRCVHCGQCVITCPYSAKWSANWVIDGFRDQENVRIMADTRVERIAVQGGRATSVVCASAQGPFKIEAQTIILSAGGLGTPVILQRSGIDAGNALFLDIFPIVYGRSKKFRAALEPSMPTIFNEDKDCGYVLSPHVDVALMFQGIKGWFGDRPPYGIMVKTGDDNLGRVDADGRVFKTLSDADRKRIETGVAEARQIFERAGVSPEEITISELTGGHPGGTAAIGEVVNPDLACKQVKNLYVCDSSVIPRSPGRPPIVLISALAKWLGNTLTQ